MNTLYIYSCKLYTHMHYRHEDYEYMLTPLLHSYCETCSCNCCSFVYHISCNCIKKSHSQEGESSPAGQQIPHLSWNLKIQHCVRHSLPLEFILSQINPVTTHTSHFFMINFNIENCDLLGYYAVRSVNFLLTFHDNLSVPSSRVNFWILDQ